MAKAHLIDGWVAGRSDLLGPEVMGLVQMGRRPGLGRHLAGPVFLGSAPNQQASNAWRPLTQPARSPGRR